MSEYTWVKLGAGDAVPENVVKGGVDSDGSEIYVGRASHEGDVIPAKVIPDKSIAYVHWDEQEHPKDEYEVLCGGEFAWETCINSVIPSDAVVGGQTSDGEPLYVGRIPRGDTHMIGKIQEGCLYIYFDEEELPFRDYEFEVLVSH